MLIASGVGALAIALGQYIRTINSLEGPHYQEIADRTQSKRPAVLLGAVMLLLGVAAFIAILVRMRLR